MRRQVDVDRVFILTKSIDDHSSELQDFSSHITATSTESTPVGKDHDRKTFLGKVTNGLSSLVGRVREKDLSSLRKDRFTRVGIGRIGGYNLFDLTSLDSNGTHGDSTKTTTSNNNTLTPSSEVFLEGSLIEESGFTVGSSHHETRIIGSRCGTEFNLSVNRVSGLANSGKSTNLLGNKTEPLHERFNTFLVVFDNLVRDSIGVHDLRSTELILRGIDRTSKQLVESRVSSQDNGTLLHLNDTLSKTDKVGSNTNTAASDVTQSKDFIVGGRGLSSNLSTSLQILNTDSVLGSNDIGESPSFRNLIGDNGSLRKFLVISITEVEVFKSLGGVGLVHELNVNLALELINKTDTSTSVTRDVQTRKLIFTGPLGSLEEELIFVNAERTTLNRNIVGNDNSLTPFGILGSLHLDEPCDHSNSVGSNNTGSQSEFSISTFNEFLRFEELVRDSIDSTSFVDVLLPLADERNLHKTKEIIGISRSNTAGNGTLGLDSVASSVGVQEAHLTHTVAFSLGVNQAVFAGNSSDWIRALNVGSRLQPLAIHGRCNKTKRLGGILSSLESDLNFDLINTQLDQTRG